MTDEYLLLPLKNIADHFETFFTYFVMLLINALFLIVFLQAI